MANPEHLKLLKRGVVEWNEWRKGDGNGNSLDLRGANLNGVDLTGVNLTGANLRGVALSRAVLIDSYFSGANFSRAHLFGTNFSGTGFNGADFRGAYLTGADLTGTDFTGANLSGAILMGAKLFRSTLKNTNFENATIGSTIFGLTDLSTAKGLETVTVQSECTIDFQTLRDSKNIPPEFLFKIGLPESYVDYLPDFYDDSPIRLFPVFLSHAHKDKAFAIKLYEALTKRKVIVWFDERQILPGDDIRKSITKGINLYDKFIIVCSEHSLKDSWWVVEEINKALKKKEKLFKEVGEHINTIIPITVDDYVFDGWESELKDNIDRFLVGDFKDWEDDAKFDQAVDILVAALNVDRGGGDVVSFLGK